MKGKKILKPVVGIMAACAILVPVLAAPVMAADYADDAVIDNALAYLEGVQDASGMIGSHGDSAWAAMAIAAADEDPGEFGNGELINYLKNESEANAAGNPTAIAKVIMAAVAACEDPTSFGPEGSEVDYVDMLKGMFDETEGQFVYEGCIAYNSDWTCAEYGTINDTINDDFWALMALVAAGEPLDSDIVTSTVDFIKANQLEDGGWSYQTANVAWSGGDPDNTGAAVMALVAAGVDPGDFAIQNALTYLEIFQDPSGGWASWGNVNVSSTTWAVDALVVAGEDPTAARWTKDANPVDYILSQQQADGSFPFSDPLPSGYFPMYEANTAYAIGSLTGNPYPVVPECPEPEFVFVDEKRGTTLAIWDSEAGTFQFTSEDGFDSGIVEADFMRVKRNRITMFHRDGDMIASARANIKRDWCLGSLLDKDNWDFYLVRDKFGVE